MVLVVIVSGINAQDQLSKEKQDAVKMVTDAAAFVKKNGYEMALVELNNPKGKFVNGSLYVFAYDTTGIMVAHPVNAKLIGKNLLEVPDVDGKLFRKEIIQIAMTKTTGWVDYKYKNPGNGQFEEKTTYLNKSDKLILCCGVYK
jgi:signal transduction histidine kinase